MARPAVTVTAPATPKGRGWVSSRPRGPTGSRRGFEVEMKEASPGEEAGLKSSTFVVRGENAYGLFAAERGVHRLIRISPFDASARRHTSFAQVDVGPLVDEDVSIELDDSDLRIDTYRASGAGGQHVNKTD